MMVFLPACDIRAFLITSLNIDGQTEDVLVKFGPHSFVSRIEGIESP